MFGLFRKRPREGSFVLVAVRSAVTLRAIEHRNGGLYTHPDVLRSATDALATKMDVDLSGSLREVTHTCVMRLLMEQTLVDDLLRRGSGGEAHSLTVRDWGQIREIIKPLVDVS
jgi:hypothetical protein